MPTTRSATRNAVTQPQQESPAEDTVGSKRKAPAATADAKKKSRKTEVKGDVQVDAAPPPTTTVVQNTAPASALNAEPDALVPATLTFSFEEAKKHLIGVDSRFEELFDRMKCRPYEHLEQVDPFRTLTHSILGQQISWMAARSITHRFVRLFDPSLPEKPTDHNKTTDPFPTAHQLMDMDIPSLRTAGLSQRKAEYVRDLAARFADGRLSTKKLLEANDEELYEMLIEVRGIGRWTVDMFAIFSLRRPDILPVGDLGVQRGVLRWFLSLHSPSYKIAISPHKLPGTTEDGASSSQATQQSTDPELLPSLTQTAKSLESQEHPDNAGASSVVAAPALPATPAPRGKKGKKGTTNDGDDVLPTPFTPSINRTLNTVADGGRIPPLPLGFKVSNLQTRLEKKVKGAYLTPKEMEDLTECWRPYRSLGVYYMWALAEESK